MGSNNYGLADNGFILGVYKEDTVTWNYQTFYVRSQVHYYKHQESRKWIGMSLLQVTIVSRFRKKAKGRNWPFLAVMQKNSSLQLTDSRS